MIKIGGVKDRNGNKNNRWKRIKGEQENEKKEEGDKWNRRTERDADERKL